MSSSSLVELPSPHQEKTPVMSQMNNTFILNTPPTDAQSTVMPCFGTPPQNIMHTPDELFNGGGGGGGGGGKLTCPAWKPPDAEEIDYTDTWNNSHDNRHHYLQPPVAQDDSTIGSNQTNDSFNVSFNPPNTLRPRGFSIHSYTGDAPSIGSCPHPQPSSSVQHGQGKHHRRHPSLPISLSGTSATVQTAFQSELRKQYLNALQSTKRSSPYELNSHHNASQIKADGAMALLDGVLLDLYMVDRSIDSASAQMLASDGGGTTLRSSPGGGSYSSQKYDTILGMIEKKPTQQEDIQQETKPTVQKPRKTSLGTLTDIQCILGLYKVDKIVDRFKQELQMPQFFEEEAWEITVWKDFRKIDVEMEEHAQKKQAKEAKETLATAVVTEVHGQEPKDPRCQFDLSDDEDDDDDRYRSRDQGELGGEGIYLSAESCLTNYDAYQFFDPHEQEVLLANSYHSSHVSASLNDNLDEVIDLLRVDAEIDGASRRHNEMVMIKPLLEIDREMDKVKESLEVKDIWVGDLKELYLVDVEVDGAKKKFSPRPKEKKIESSSGSTAQYTSNEKGKEEYIMSPMTTTKKILSQHIPQVSLECCQTSPEHVPKKTAASQTQDFALPPAVPIASSQQISTRRAIFSTQEQSMPDKNMIPGTAASVAPPKRSIFSSQEKTQGSGGVMMPGTTTVVAKGADKIDDIPVAKVIMK